LQDGGQIAVEDGLAGVIENVGVEASGVEIDAAVICVRLVAVGHGS